MPRPPFRCPAVPEPQGPLTIEATQLGGQRGLQDAAAVQECGLQLGSTVVGQVLLHLAGAAGVALGADPQVLTCGGHGVRQWRGRRLGAWTRLKQLRENCRLQAGGVSWVEWVWMAGPWVGTAQVPMPG